MPSDGSHYVLAAGAVVGGVRVLLAFPAWMALLTDVTDEAQRGSVLELPGWRREIGAITGAVLAGSSITLPGPLLGIGHPTSDVLSSRRLMPRRVLRADGAAGQRAEARAGVKVVE